MDRKTLLILETSDIGCKYTAEAARKLGFSPVFLADLRNYQADTLEQLRRETVLDVPTTDAQHLYKHLQHRGMTGIAAVVTFLDSRLRVATELARLLNVSGHDPVCEKLKDKIWVQGLVPEYSPRTLRLSSQTSSDCSATPASRTRATCCSHLPRHTPAASA